MKMALVLSVLLLATRSTLFSQSSGFSVLANRLLLNAWRDTLQGPEHEFIERYATILSPRPGTWGILSRMTTLEPGEPAIHSFVFYRYPDMDIPMVNGQLDFYTLEKKGKVIGVQDIQVWLDFDDKSSAVTAFNKIGGLFLLQGGIKVETEAEGRKVDEIENPNSEEVPRKVLLILLENPLKEKKYRIFFGFVYPQFTKNGKYSDNPDRNGY